MVYVEKGSKFIVSYPMQCCMGYKIPLLNTAN